MNPLDGLHGSNINLYTRLTPEIAGAIKDVLDQLPETQQALDARFGKWPDPRIGSDIPW